MTTQIILNIRDKSGTQGTTEVKIAGTPTIAQMTGFTVAWAEAINDIILGVIDSAVAYLRPDVSSLDEIDNTVEEMSNVEQYAKFELVTSGGNRVKFNIPAISEAFTNTDDLDDIDQTQAEVAAVIDALLDGITVTGAANIQPCDVGGVSLVSVLFAREAFSNSGARR